jgi:nitrite reductase/ring-hydroxylating ferredoxin subunit/uncharacterized membrane protein
VNVVEAIERAEALDKISVKIGTVASKAFPHGIVKDAVSGRWLGHPLHPVLTDLPIGFWTSAMVCDLLGMDEAADACVGLGVASALPTAVTGLSDWTDTWEEPQRIGLFHAAGNLLAVALYGASWLARRAGMRRRGVALAFAGGGVATLAAYLGGQLTMRRGIGINQTAFEERPKEWTSIMRADALAEGKPSPAQAGGIGFLVVKRSGVVHVLSDRCTHRGGPLHEGELTDGCIRCPWHGSEFRLEDGSIEKGPATAPQPSYDVREQDGWIEVRATR